ncbi:hypothetical protein TCAL_09969, partial [Tigriopus californicus]
MARVFTVNSNVEFWIGESSLSNVKRSCCSEDLWNRTSLLTGKDSLLIDINFKSGRLLSLLEIVGMIKFILLVDVYIGGTEDFFVQESRLPRLLSFQYVKH